MINIMLNKKIEYKIIVNILINNYQYYFTLCVLHYIYTMFSSSESKKMEASFIANNDPFSSVNNNVTETPKTDITETPKTNIKKTRHVYFNELKTSGRFVAISFTYEHDNVNMQTNVKYGACVYRKENEKDFLNKKGIMKTSENRFNKYSNTFILKYKNEEPPKYGEVTKKIRKMMMTMGCCNTFDCSKNTNKNTNLTGGSFSFGKLP